MKKISVIMFLMLILIMLNGQVLAISSAHIATMTAASVAASTAARSSHSDPYNIYKAIDKIYAETLNEDLKQYIIENEDYLYLDTEEEATAVVNKYKESNLEETKQFIRNNYYDENKPKKDKITVIVFISIAVILIVVLVICFIRA